MCKDHVHLPPTLAFLIPDPIQDLPPPFGPFDAHPRSNQDLAGESPQYQLRQRGKKKKKKGREFNSYLTLRDLPKRHMWGVFHISDIGFF
jgi:hypothetical protein